MNLFHSLNLFLLFLSSAGSNLLCNGDFQYYSPITNQPFVPDYRPTEIYERTNIPQNSTCWYLQNSTEYIDIKRVSNPPVAKTTVCDLVGSNKSYYLCQKTLLNINSTYSLTFDVVSNQNKMAAPVIVYLNNLYIFQLLITDYMTIFSGATTFISNSLMNEICFYYNNPQAYIKGVNIDNITLKEIFVFSNSSNSNLTSNSVSNTNASTNISTAANIGVNTTFINNYLFQEQKKIIKFRKLVSTFNQDSFIVIQTNFFVPQQYYKQFVQQINIVCRKDPQKYLNFSFNYQNNTSFSISIYNSIELYNSLQISFPSNIFYGSHIISFIAIQQFNYDNFDFYAEMMRWIKIITRTFLCSYVIFYLIGIWNLLLLYYFLLITTLPTFTKVIISSLTYIFYSQNSLFSTIPNFAAFMETLQDSWSKQYEQQLKMPQYISSSFWFGKIGFYSNFFANNLEIFLLILCLIFKLLILKLIRRFLGKKFGFKKISFQFCIKIFLTEIISLSPQILVGATVNLINTTYTCFSSKLSLFLGISIIILISFFIFLSFLLNARKLQRKKRNYWMPLGKKNDQKIYFNLLHLAVPVLAALREKYSFFGWVFLILFIRFRCFWKNKELFKGFTYFKLLTIQMGWLLYHITFIFFWVLQEFIQVSRKEQWETLKYIAGLYLIFFIFYTAAIEIFSSLLKLIKALGSLKEKVKQIWKESKEKEKEMQGERTGQKRKMVKIKVFLRKEKEQVQVQVEKQKKQKKQKCLNEGTGGRNIKYLKERSIKKAYCRK